MHSHPTQTSVWSSEPQNEPYTIPFAAELIQFIKDRKKVKTYRFGMKYNYLNLGDEIAIKETGQEDILFKAIITNKQVVPFSGIPLDVDGHETYKDKEEQRKIFSGYYKYIGRQIKDDDQFLIFDFFISWIKFQPSFKSSWFISFKFVLLKK